MSRRVCETCAWCVMGTHAHGICLYRKYVDSFTARHWSMTPVNAAERIRMGDDTCKSWERDEEDEHE